MTKKACLKVKLIQSETGAILTEDACTLERWWEYCANLYSAPDSDTASDATQRTSETSDNTTARLGWDRTEPVPSIEETEKAWKSLKPDKAVGPDGIPSEMLKLGGDKSVAENNRYGPLDWVQSTFVPLHNKADPTVCANYRTISLISHASKVMLKVIQTVYGKTSNCDTSA